MYLCRSCCAGAQAFQFLIYLFTRVFFRLQFPSLPFILVDFVRKCNTMFVILVAACGSGDDDGTGLKSTVVCISHNLMDSRDRLCEWRSRRQERKFFSFFPRKRSETNEMWNEMCTERNEQKRRREKSCKWNETFSIIFIVPSVPSCIQCCMQHTTHSHTHERSDYHEHRRKKDSIQNEPLEWLESQQLNWTEIFQRFISSSQCIANCILWFDIPFNRHSLRAALKFP